MRNKLSKIYWIFALIPLILTSCEVGLGSSVDTEPPALVINSPASASIIRDAFVIQGNWTDDGEIKKVTCDLKNTDNSKKQFLFDGEVTTTENGEGTWSVIIDDDSIIDGPYEATVTIVDTADHETKATRQIVIDNTSPVVVLKRPSSKKGAAQSDVDSYGQLFMLKGLAADDSGVGLIEVKIYSDEELTELVKTVSMKNVPNTISLDVAQFEEGIENAYSEIYGSTNRTSGEQKRWCRVTAYDGAQSYPIDGSEQTEEDRKGNASTTYYLYEDISSSLLNDYKITELYAMKNGTYTGEENVQRAAINTLNMNEISEGVFTLNPANNPRYTVSGYQELNKDGQDFSTQSRYVRNGRALNIDVKPGLDSYAIVKDTLKVYLTECDLNGNATGSSVLQEQASITQNGTAYSITLPVSKDYGLRIGKTYLLTVTGNDEKSNPIVTEGNGYGFYLASNGQKPTLKITSPDSSAMISKKGTENSVTITGTVFFPSDTSEGGSVVIKDSLNDLMWNVASFYDTETERVTDKDLNWSITLNFLKDGTNSLDSEGKACLPDGEHLLTVYALIDEEKQSLEDSVGVERTIRVDTKNPDAPVPSLVQEQTYSPDKWYSTLNLKVKLNANDSLQSGYQSGLLQSEYGIQKNGTVEKWIPLSSVDEGYINGLTEGINTLCFRSTDLVGNVSGNTTSNIKVDSTVPIIKNASLGSYTDAEQTQWFGKELIAGSVLNVKSTDHKKLKIEIEENYILTNVTVTLAGIPFAGNFVQKTDTQNNPTKNWIWESTAEAEFEENKDIIIAVTAIDAAGGTTVTEYKAIIDTAGPVIEITSPEENLSGEKSVSGDYTLRAGISDATGTATETKYYITQTEFENNDAILVSARTSSEWIISSPGNVNQKISLTDTTAFPVTQGKWYFYVYSKDEAGNDNATGRSFWVDKAAPAITVTTAPKQIYNKQDLTNGIGNITLSGTISDDNGIKSDDNHKKDAVYSIDNGINWNSLSLSDSGEWSFTKTFGPGNETQAAELSDGNYTFVIKATDNADRVSQKTYKLLIDTVEPGVSSFNITEQSVSGWYNSLVLNAEVTANDATSEVTFVQYSTDYNEDNQSGIWTPLTPNLAANQYAGPVTFEASGVKNIYIKVTDSANNTSITSYSKNIDAEKPLISAKYTLVSGTKSIFGGTSYVNGSVSDSKTFVFFGEIRDDLSGVGGITLKIGDDNLDATVTYSETELPSSVSGTLPSDFGELTDSNRKTVKSWKAEVSGDQFVNNSGVLSIAARDISGNSETAQQTTIFEFDNIPPEVNRSTIKMTDNSAVTRAYKSSAESAEVIEYYVNNSTDKTFTIEGVSFDLIGVAATTLKIGDTSYDNIGSATSWKFEIDNLSSYISETSPVSSVEAKIVVIDMAGNLSSEQKVVIKFDRTAPAHSGEVTIGSKPYSSGMWATSTVLAVSGSLTENGSGAAKVIYNTGLTTGVIEANGTTFSGNITDLTEGENSILLTVEDNVGNSQSLTTEPFLVCIDTKAPTLSSTSGGTQFSNGTQPVILSGICSDSDSGSITGGSTVQSVTVSVVIDNKTHSVDVTPSDGNWTATITKDMLSGIANDGEYDIKATAKDIAGNESASLTVAKLKGDKFAPTVSESVTVSPSVTVSSGLLLHPGKEITVKGITDDNLSTTVYTWLKLVPYKEGTNGDAKNIYESTDTQHIGSTARSWTFTIPANTISAKTLTSPEGYEGAKLYVCTKDLAGNSAEVEKADLIFDVTGPQSPTVTKVSNKDYNPDPEMKNWYNSENLIFKGSWTDLAGVSNVYYEIVKPKDDGSPGKSTINNTNADNGNYSSFTLSDKGDGRYEFSSEIRDFVNGTNTLIMYAKDSFGNISTSPWTGIIYVDTNPPEAGVYTDEDGRVYSFTDSYLTNGNTDITLYFWAKDAANESGINTLPSISLSGNSPHCDVCWLDEDAEKGHLVKAIIYKDSLTVSGNKLVSSVITDKAGNQATINLGTINIDVDPPTVTLNPLTDADIDTNGIQVNKTITIKGTATDKRIKIRPLTKFEYSTDDNTNWKNLITDFTTANTALINLADFSLTIDTTKAPFENGSTYYIRATVEDEAGNSNTSEPISFTVDQDSDRPVISFMDITVPDIPADSASTETVLKLVNNRKLRVTVSDDDDGIYSIAVIVGTTELTNPQGGNGTYVFELPYNVQDGTHDLKFTVVDKVGNEAGETFVSGTDKAPKYTDGTQKINKPTLKTKLMIDSHPPVIQSIQYAYYKGECPATLTWESDIPALGGTREKLAVKICAGDENKISAVKASINGTEYTGDKQGSGSTADVFDDSDSKYYSNWIIKDIDVSKAKLEAGNYKLELTITDSVEGARTDNVQFNIDRTPPVIDITTPIPQEGVITTYSSGSTNANGSISGASKLYYALSPSNTKAPDGTAVGTWQEYNGAGGTCSNATLNPIYSSEIDFSTTWNINFDGDTSATTGVHADLLNTYLMKFGITTQAALEATENPFTNIVKLYLWLKAEDEVGNVKEEQYPVYVNPQGDRPTIYFSSPNDGAKLGKAVSIYGTHADTIGTSADKTGVQSVWVQIISEAHGEDATNSLTNKLKWSNENVISTFDFTDADLTYMYSIIDGNGNKVYDIRNMRTGEAYSGTIASGYEARHYAALAKISGAAWNFTLNSQGEFNNNSSSTDGKNPVGIRVFAKDGDEKINTLIAQKLVFFDTGTPLIEELKLEQYDSNNQLISTRAYAPDMYISFKNNTIWKLKGKATDASCITALKIDGISQTVTGTNKTESFEKTLSKAGSPTAGTISFAIEATDDSEHTGIEEISIRYDDLPPELVTSGSDYNINAIIRQDNGFYKFGSVAKEDSASDGTPQSGFAYTAFYFMRGTKLYDILKPKSDSKISENANADSGLSYNSDDHLYWYTKTVVSRENANSVLTLAAGQTMEGIRKNALVKVDGAYYLITNVDETNNSFTISGNPLSTTTIVYVAAAAIIDNTAREQTKDNTSPELSDGYYSASNLKFDDGDRMLEYVYKSGSSWQWEASVCSKNISDGPVKLVYVAFDEAGNFAVQTADALICNNTPRIAGFSIFTDYNNNGSVDDEGIDGKYIEYLASTYSAKSKTGTTESGLSVYNPDEVSSVDNQKHTLKNKLTVGEAGKPVMTLRGKTILRPEIVGGNGKVYYDYNINGKTNTTCVEMFEGSTDYTINSKEINIQLGDLVSFEDIDCTEFKFTFHDSMEDRENLSSYNLTVTELEEAKSILSIYMGIAAAASKAPVVKIEPFYWKGINNNSIYGSSTANSYKDLIGHIELEDDWKETDKYKNNGAPETSGEYDADPKVSGQIVVTGSVHDDNLIKEIKIKFGDFINEVIVATFNAGSLTVDTNSETGVGEDRYATNGYWFEITEEKFSASGHDVKWKLYLNTEKVGGSVIAATDVPLSVFASNNGTPTCNPTEDEGSSVGISIDGTTMYSAASYPTSIYNIPGIVNTTKAEPTAFYRMDIVPYITSVTTKLSDYNSATPSIYDRSALGHYPVYMTFKSGGDASTTADNYSKANYETVTIAGFNMTADSADGNTKSASFTGTSGNTAKLLASETGNYTIKIPSGAKSGNLTVSINGIESINNFNNDNSHGDFASGTIPPQGDYTVYTNFYNRRPNNINNNNLTDDVYFDIWDFNYEAALAESSGLVDNLEMKINPANGLIGFAFTNGSTRFSMPKKDTSYTKWNRSYDYMKHNALAYDTSGNSYAVSVGGDINADGGFDFFAFMTSQWGNVGDSQGSNKGTTKHLNIDSIAYQNKNTKNKDRFQNQSIATNGNNIYLAYYDMLAQQIRFKAGVITTSASAFGNFKQNDPTHITQINESTGAVEYKAVNKYSTTPKDELFCQIIAGGDTSKSFGDVGEYVSIGALPAATSDSKDIVAITWFDGTNLKFAYNTDPLKHVTQTSTIYAKDEGSGWSSSSTILYNGGEYCQLAVANDKSIHIAAYDSSNANLVYIYIPFDDTNKVPKVAKKVVSVVDSYLDVGEQLTIDVAQVGTRQIPYIGYWGTYPEKPRYAFLAKPEKFYASTDAVVNGAEGNYYTGVWECTVVPSQSSVKDNRKINVGVWKYNGTATDDGKLAWSTTGANRGKENGTNSYNKSTADTGTGKCYGNGTKNGVLAYVVAPSSSQYCAETAQMR